MGYEGAGIWFFRRLRALGALDALPPESRGLLKAQAVETAALGLHIEDEAIAVVECLMSAGIPVILIKGMARRALAQRYSYLDARPTHDIDLLLPPDQVREGHALLQARGYRPAYRASCLHQPHHHLPALWSDRKVAVELHESTSLRVPGAVAWARVNAGSEELEWGGLTVRVPGPTELVWSAMVHALSDEIALGFRLQHFLEVAALVVEGAPVDWSIVEARSTTGEAHDPENGIGYPPAVVLAWLDAALSLVAADLRPAGLDRPDFDLGRLLQWRLLVLGYSGRLKGSLAERLLDEGARTLIGLPLRRPPGSASWPQRIRGRTAGRASRVLFQAWRMALAH